MSTSTRNPFRTPAVSPNPTGSSITSLPPFPHSVNEPSSSNHPAQQGNGPGSSNGESAPAKPTTYAPPPGPPPTVSPPPSFTSGRSESIAPSHDEGLDPSGLTEEMPPAYTPAPDPYQGESTVEFGPRRPFQRAPPPPVAPVIPQPSGWSQHTAHYAPPPHPPPSQSSGWGAYPGQRPPPLPPRRPSSAGSSVPASAAPVSDFARDFYAAGAGPSPGSSSTNRYAPPPGPPPTARHRPSAEQLRSGNGEGSIPDDGRPTRTPKPGHPLLHNGKMLVYPVGYECPKCHNTGFKYYDPSHPCRKCWEKYARPYSGALAYAPAAPGTSTAGNNFQRPLPSLRPPHLSHPQSQSSSNVGRSRSQHIPLTAPRPTTSLSPQMPVHLRSTSNPNPPPGSVVVRPGDPRIGGRLCWKCGGRGQTSFLVFEEITCAVCGGVGRVF
ncbi:hypothetical protein PLICRDRAFT_244054 [Plicaturopsis crispa FD-325 SS-3]|nr:hypothetical protein PLICRDRAFT_244054 [Plicaturopsis crispa FD-325 SS-3]